PAPKALASWRSIKLGTPHSLPEGDSSSFGIMVSEVAEKNATSSAVSTSQVSTGSAAAASAGFVVSAAVSAAALALAAPAPARKPRRGISAIAGSSLCPLRDSLSGTLIRITGQEQGQRAGDEDRGAAGRSRSDSPSLPAR